MDFTELLVPSRGHSPQGKSGRCPRAHEPGQDRLCTLAGCKCYLEQPRVLGAGPMHGDLRWPTPASTKEGQHLFFLKQPSSGLRRRGPGAALKGTRGAIRARGATHSFPRRGSELPLR